MIRIGNAQIRTLDGEIFGSCPVFDDNLALLERWVRDCHRLLMEEKGLADDPADSIPEPMGVTLEETVVLHLPDDIYAPEEDGSEATRPD